MDGEKAGAGVRVVRMIRSGFKPRATTIKAGARRKSRTRSTREHMSLVAEIGCIACLIAGTPDTPAELHHPRTDAGAGQKAPDSDVIPLCPPHHRGTMHPAIPSIHLDRKKFIEQFCTEAELLARVREITGESK